MKLKKITIDNYAPFDEVLIEFDQNSYIIVGVNNTDEAVASNGAGKSCLIQAIIWALFGSVVRQGLLVDDIIGSLRSHVRVVIEFEHKGKSWKIDRARKFSGRRNNEPIVTIDGEDVSRHKDNDSFIEDQLGFTFDMFMLSAYSDADTIPFCRLSPASMLKNLVDVLDLDKIDDLVVKIKDCVKDLKSMSSSVKNQHKSMQSNVASLERSYESTKSTIDDFEEQRSRAARGFENEISALDREASNLEEELEQLPRYIQIEKAISIKVEESAVYEKNLKSLEVLKSDLLLKESSIASRMKALLKELGQLKSEYNNLALNDLCLCNHCGSRFNPNDVTDRVIKIARQIEELEISRLDLERSASINKEDLDKKLIEIDRVKIHLKEFVGAHKDKQEIALLLRDLKHADERKTQIQINMIPRIERQLKEINSKSIEPYRKTLEDQFNKIEGTKLDLLNLESDEFFVLKKIDFVASFLSRVMNLKTIVLQDFVMSLQDQININLELASTDIRCSIEFEEKKMLLLFTNSSKQGSYLPYSIFSRGERSKIDKACGLALNDLFGIGIYLDDEGLSGIDWEAAKGLLDFLTSSSDTRILVFHNERIQSYLQQRQIGLITVEKNNGISQAKIN